MSTERHEENGVETIKLKWMPGITMVPGITFGLVNVNLTINGDVNHPFMSKHDQTGLFVVQLKAGGAAAVDGRLRVGDRILQVNNVSVESVTQTDFSKILNSLSDGWKRDGLLRFTVKHNEALGRKIIEWTRSSAGSEDNNHRNNSNESNNSDTDRSSFSIFRWLMQPVRLGFSSIFGASSTRREKRPREKDDENEVEQPRSRHRSQDASSASANPPAHVTKVFCPVCLDNTEEMRNDGKRLMVTNCGHVFCDKCIEDVVEKRRRCPVCNEESPGEGGYRALFL